MLGVFVCVVIFYLSKMSAHSAKMYCFFVTSEIINADISTHFMSHHNLMILYRSMGYELLDLARFLAYRLQKGPLKMLMHMYLHFVNC